ncbi:hypothetical protein ABT160_46705 [Streptomyces sp. NPDC001941]|uniref:hypothetical protein n=1 Tax=Streptomyces sp. NPDC001941 TaxID=3154659 RepID=UPI0033299695
MDPAKTPGRLAADAAKAVRALNHATTGGNNYTRAADVGETASSVRTLTEELRPSLAQMATALSRLGADGRIRMADDTDPVAAAADCGHALHVARAYLDLVLEQLALVTALTSHMRGPRNADGQG